MGDVNVKGIAKNIDWPCAVNVKPMVDSHNYMYIITLHIVPVD